MCNNQHLCSISLYFMASSIFIDCSSKLTGHSHIRGCGVERNAMRQTGEEEKCHSTYYQTRKVLPILKGLIQYQFMQLASSEGRTLIIKAVQERQDRKTFQESTWCHFMKYELITWCDQDMIHIYEQFVSAATKIEGGKKCGFIWRFNYWFT